MKRIVMIVVAIIATSLSGIDSGDFQLGTYSYLGNKEFVYNNKDSLIAWMDSLSYNVNIMELFQEGTQPDGQIVHSEDDFSLILDQMDARSIKAIIMDRCWEDGLYEYSSHYLTRSNYVKLEAEIFDESNLTDYPTNEDKYWYGSTVVKSSRNPIPFIPDYDDSLRVGEYVNGGENAWYCTPSDHNAGFAYGDLQSRWGSGVHNPLVGNLFSIQVPPPTQTYPYINPVFTDSDAMYVTYHIKIENAPVSPTGIPLLYFSIAGYRKGSGGDWFFSDIALPITVTGPDNSVIPDGLMTNTYFSSLAPSYTGGYFDVTVKVTFQQLFNSGLISYNNNWTIPSLNPRLFWYDNCTMYLDYITIEDSVHSMLDPASTSYSGDLAIRAQRIVGLGPEDNVIGIYTHDEPTQAQFDSYKLMNECASAYGIRQMTAVNRRGYPDVKKTDLSVYNHYPVFDYAAQPNVYMPDPYPVKGNVDWSKTNATGDGHLQKELDSMVTSVYDYNRRQCDSSELFYPVVQAFGRWKDGEWVKDFMLPPTETQKMLQYLPLCFGADGIFNYRLIGYKDNDGNGDYCALQVKEVEQDPKSYDPPTLDPVTYDVLKECNPRVLRYGEILNGDNVVWYSAATLSSGTIEAVNVNHPVNMSNFMLAGVQLEQDDSTEYYKGYVQVGFYKDADNDPYLMLVNRRSNYFDGTLGIDSANHVPPNSNYNSYFLEFPSQTVVIAQNQAANSTYGTHVAMYDPYDNHIYLTQGGWIEDVVMESGDGILLQMCSSLPSSVTSDAVLKKTAYLSGNITIDDESEVSIEPDTVTEIISNTTIRVKGGSSLSLSGEVSIRDNVTIIVEEGSTINLDNAVCYWGEGSLLQVNGSTLNFTGSSCYPDTLGHTWEGIFASNSSDISLNSTIIDGAETNDLVNSDVYVNNSRFNVPSDAVGLHIENSNTNYTVKIEATEADKGFYGEGATSIGLVYKNVGAAVKIWNLNFVNLGIGLSNLSNSAIRDSIVACTFVDNSTGIHFYGSSYSPFITDCSFYENEIGVYLEVAYPVLRDCLFDQCELGILTELSTGSTGGIYDCIFQSGETAIVSRGSNLRVAGNLFYTEYGILNHSGSVLNMGNSAKNLFDAGHINLKFEDTISYNARVQLYMGHNDFYHEIPGPLEHSHDFHFDSNWYVSPPPRSNAIDARYNWFEDGSVQISCPGLASNYVSCSVLDPSPNVELEGSDRMAQALSSENLGDYPGANSSYKSILNEDLVTESELLYDAMDGYYRTSDPADELPSAVESYLLAKISQYDAENPILVKYAQDYLVKSYLKAKAYQTAIDLIQGRIDNPESAVDSLLAVMDLEIVLQLAAMDEAKKPITTKYTQFVYPNRQVFVTKHAEHWEKLNRLLDNEGEEIMPIPVKAVIGSNYPNPFNPSTTISFSIPKDSLVKLSVFNLRGQKIKDLLDEDMARGHHKIVWDGKDSNNRLVSSGLYFLKLEAAGNISTQKVMLMK